MDRSAYSSKKPVPRKKEEVIEQSNNLTEHILKSTAFISQDQDVHYAFDTIDINSIADNILKNADKQWGGFGNAPKFPQTYSIQFLLRHYHFTQSEASLNQALLSLKKMIQGGIYDHLGGGFARYSTDTRWQIPHFEKMLYDNALLINVLSEAYQITKEPIYADTLHETIQFLQNELSHQGGGFFSALDADSEGIEGKYYVWQKKEIETLLGADSEVFCRCYDVKAEGNWEHVNILWMPEDIQSLSVELQIEENKLKEIISRGKKILFENRKLRERPLLDDKILLGWNSLAITALCKAYAATGEEGWRERPLKPCNF